MVQCENIASCMSPKVMGETVQNVLKLAHRSKRLTLGFSDAIKLLSKTPEEAQFCFLAEPKRGDSATHMHEVLLQAFCYEHGIYIIKVDSGRKLAHILGMTNADESCVLIQKGSKKSRKSSECRDINAVAMPMPNATIKTTSQTTITTTPSETDIKTTANAIDHEDMLVEFCESCCDANYCVVKLPES